MEESLDSLGDGGVVGVEGDDGEGGEGIDDDGKGAALDEYGNLMDGPLPDIAEDDGIALQQAFALGEISFQPGVVFPHPSLEEGALEEGEEEFDGEKEIEVAPGEDQDGLEEYPGDGDALGDAGKHIVLLVGQEEGCVVVDEIA